MFFGGPGHALEAERQAEQVACESLGALGILWIDGHRTVHREPGVLPGEQQLDALVSEQLLVTKKGDRLVSEQELGCPGLDVGREHLRTLPVIRNPSFDEKILSVKFDNVSIAKVRHLDAPHRITTAELDVQPRRPSSRSRRPRSIAVSIADGARRWPASAR